MLAEDVMAPEATEETQNKLKKERWLRAASPRKRRMRRQILREEYASKANPLGLLSNGMSAAVPAQSAPLPSKATSATVAANAAAQVKLKNTS